MEGIQNSNVFRPIPVNPLQKNLADFYSTTSKMVKERFDEMRGTSGQETQTGSASSIEESVFDRKPLKSGIPWLGRLIDVFA